MTAFQGFRYITPLSIGETRWERSSETLTLVRQVLTNGAQRWTLDITLEPDSKGAKRAGGKMQAHKAKHGMGGKFSLPMPQHLGVPEFAKAVTVSVAALASSESIMVKANPGNPQTWTIPEGRFIAFAGHTKVYIVTDDLKLVRSNPGKLMIYPALQKSVALNAAIDDTPDILVQYLAEALVSEQYRDGILYSPTLRVEEAV